MTDQVKKDIKKSRGRPATGQGEQILLRMHSDLLNPLDAFCSDQQDTPGRQEAIRRILIDWLTGAGYIYPDKK